MTGVAIFARFEAVRYPLSFSG